MCIRDRYNTVANNTSVFSLMSIYVAALPAVFSCLIDYHSISTAAAAVRTWNTCMACDSFIDLEQLQKVDGSYEVSVLSRESVQLECHRFVRWAGTVPAASWCIDCGRPDQTRAAPTRTLRQCRQACLRPIAANILEILSQSLLCSSPFAECAAL